MSNFGQGVLAVAGGVIGFLVGGGPTGALYGFQIGLLAGSVAFPTEGPTVQRPRLTDVSTTGSSVGSPIPRGYGTFDAAGQVIVQSDLREVIVSSEVGGKGAPTQTIETPTYYQDFAIGLNDGLIGGILRIWANGKIIYDRRPQQSGEDTSTFNARIAASTSLDEIMTVYVGSETQLEDPTLQMRLTDGVSAFRGLAYVVFTNWQNKDEDGQRMPQTWKFELFTDGAVDETGNLEYSNEKLYPWGLTVTPENPRNVNTKITTAGLDAYTWDNSKGIDENARLCATGFRDWPDAVLFSTTVAGGDGFASQLGGTNVSSIQGEKSTTVTVRYGPYTVQYNTQIPFPAATCDPAPNNPVSLPGKICFSTQWDYDRTTDISGLINTPVPSPPFYPFTSTTRCSVAGTYWIEKLTSITCEFQRGPGAPPNPCEGMPTIFGFTSFCVDAEGGVNQSGEWTLDMQQYLVLRSFEGSTTATQFPLSPALPISHPGNTQAFWDAAYAEAVASGDMPEGLAYSALGNGDIHTTYPHSQDHGYFRVVNHNTITTSEIPLEDIVRSICLEAGYENDQIETSAIAGITIIGFVRAAIMPGRGALDPLRSLGFFDIIEQDAKVVCVKRGGSIVRQLEVANLGAHTDGAEQPVNVTTTVTLDYELPVQVRVHYKSPSRDYEPGEQLSLPRVNTDAVGIADIDLAAVISDSFAAKIAEVLHNDMWQSRYQQTTTVDISQMELMPTDPLRLPVDTEYQRVRIVSIRDTGFLIREIAFVREDDGSYISIAVADPPVFATKPIKIPSPVGIIPLDIPALHDTDDDAGFYMACYPLLKGGSLTGGAVFKSNDDAAYGKSANFANAAIVGTLDDVLGDVDDSDVIDWNNSIAVELYEGTLSNITEAQLLSGNNAAAVGADGRWEIVQFVNAENTVGNHWILTGLARGRRGTEHAIGATLKGDRFVLLTGDGLCRILLQNSEIGAERFYRGVGVGASVESSVTVPFTGHGEALKPFSPVAVEAQRSNITGDWTITYIRRNRLGQAMPDGNDIAMSETTLAFEIDIYDGIDVVRTLSSTGLSVIYTAAQQIEDFTDPITSISACVFQVSSVVTRGYPGCVVATDGTALAPPLPADFIRANQDEPILLSADGYGGGVIRIAAKGTLAGRPCIGIITKNGSTWRCDSTTYAYGGIPDSYFYFINEDGKFKIPNIADQSATAGAFWHVFFRAQPPPNTDAASHRFLLGNRTDGYSVELTPTLRTDAILATEQIMELLRYNGSDYALCFGNEVFKSTDHGASWVSQGNTTGLTAYADRTSPVKMLVHVTNTQVIAIDSFDVWYSSNVLAWTGTGIVAALQGLGYGSTLPIELIDVASDGTRVVVAVSTFRDSDSVPVNLIVRTSDLSTWTLEYEQSFNLGTLATGQRWKDLVWFNNIFCLYGVDAFTSAYPQVLKSTDNGDTWAKSFVVTDAVPASSFVNRPRFYNSGSGKVAAIVSNSSREILGVTQVYGAVAESSDGITFTTIGAFEP